MALRKVNKGPRKSRNTWPLPNPGPLALAIEEECKNNFAWDHVIIDGAPGHYRLYSNDHGKFVLDDMFPDWS